MDTCDSLPKRELQIQQFLNGGGTVEQLQTTLGIKVTYHTKLPLIICNYDHVLTPHDNLIGIECRGLVLEDKTWNLVAKSMNRFFNWGELQILNSSHPNLNPNLFNFENFETQSKEDGSLMVLYNYKDTWMLNTRTQFLSGMPPNKKILMAGIHENDIQDIINIFLKGVDNVNSLEEFDKYLDKQYTYCFEFCDQINKIVREYPPHTIYLLAVINNFTLQEKDSEFINVLAQKIGLNRPTNYSLKTIEEVLEAMKQMSNKDPSLEGFVIRDCNGARWKIKSQSYFFLHHVTYDRMRTPVPGDLVNLILQGEGSELFSILQINSLAAELDEVKKAWEFCQQRLKSKYQELSDIWEQIRNINEKGLFEQILINSQTPLKDMLRELYYQHKRTQNDLYEKWRNNPDLLVDKLFSESEKKPPNKRTKELVISDIQTYKKSNQYPKYPQFNLFLQEKWWQSIQEKNDGLAVQKPYYHEGKWIVTCFCGTEMKLFEVPIYLAVYKCIRSPLCQYCQKNPTEDQNKSKNKTSLIYQCICDEFHAAHQTEKKIENELARRPMRGKPLGIPCSNLTRSLRHKAHEKMQLIIENFGWSKDQVYREAANITEQAIDKSHIGMLGITNLKKLIDGFNEMLGDYI